MGIHASAIHAISGGILAAALFSGGLGWYRRGLAAGLILAVCSGTILSLVMSPLLAPLKASGQGSVTPFKVANVPSNSNVSDDLFERTCQAWQLGVLAGFVVSVMIGCCRYGLVTGVFLGICTGAVLVAATIPFWLTLFALVPRLV